MATKVFGPADLQLVAASKGYSNYMDYVKFARRGKQKLVTQEGFNVFTVKGFVATAISWIAGWVVGAKFLPALIGPIAGATSALDVTANIASATATATAGTTAAISQGISLALGAYGLVAGENTLLSSAFFGGLAYGAMGAAQNYWQGVHLGFPGGPVSVPGHFLNRPPAWGYNRPPVF